jgi:predicted DNA-binding transcriptional regulator YafY
LEIPIYFEDGYKLLEKPQTLLQLLSPEEKSALKILSRADGDLLQGKTGQLLKSAARKLLSANGQHSQREPGSVLACLEAAISTRSEISLLYCSLGRRDFRLVVLQPLAIFIRRSAWYAAAYSLEHRQVRTYRVARMRAVRQTGQYFSPPPDFSLQKYLGSAFDIETGETIEVCLQLSRKAAQNLEERHHHAILDWEDDAESGDVRCRLQVAGSAEIARWILRWSGEAKCVSPLSLRAEIAAAARRIAQQHED